MRNNYSHAAPCAPRNFFLIALQYIESTGTHGADAEQTYFDGFHIVFVVDKKSRRQESQRLLTDAAVKPELPACPATCGASR